MQRLLRGRFLYWALSVLVLVLYVWTLSGGPLPFPSSTPHPRLDDTLEMWPKELDFTTLRHLLSRRPSLALMVSALSLFSVVMGLGGLLMAGWGLWTGRIRTVWRFRSRRLPRWSFGELGRITILTVLIASLMPFVRLAAISAQVWWALDAHVWVTMSMLFLDCFVILTVLTFATAKGRSVKKTLGFSTRHLSRSVVIGLRGYVAIFPWLFILLYLITEFIRMMHLQPPLEPIHELIFQEQRPKVLMLTMFLACVVGPMAEEFFFRGIVYTTIRQKLSRGVAMLISGALFALVHSNVVGFLPIMVLGCLLAHLYERTGSLASPLAIHILHNTFLMSTALVFRQLTPL